MESFEILMPFEKTVNSKGELVLFGGIASNSTLDRDMERMDKSIMPKIAHDLLKNSTVFFNHDTKGLGVGVVKSAEVINGAVHISIVPTKAEGMKDVITQINEGVLKSFSIGGRIKDWENQHDEKIGKSVRVIKDVECYEVSVVGVPSNPDASVLSYITKSFKGENMAEKGLDMSQHLAQEKKESEVGQGETVAHEASETYSEEIEEHGVKMVKCGHCQKLSKFNYKAEPQGGPAELAPSGHGHEEIETKAMKIVESESFKKVLDDFSKKVSEKYAPLEKSNVELSEKLVSANAQIELLKKSIDEKFSAKSLAADGTEEIHKNTEADLVKEAPVETVQKTAKRYSVFPVGKSF